MKKSLFFASLLASLLLVGCGQSETPDKKPSEDNTSETVKPSEDVKPSEPTYKEPTAIGKLVLDYDLSTIEGHYDKDPSKNTIYFGPKGESVNITDSFTNKVTDSTVVLESVMSGTEGVERAQSSQGPKIGGIKLNNKDGVETKDASLTFTFAAGSSVDQVIFEVGTWPAKGETVEHSFKINDTTVTVPAGAPMNVKVALTADDMTSIKIQALSGRPVISGVKFYNK